RRKRQGSAVAPRARLLVMLPLNLVVEKGQLSQTTTNHIGGPMRPKSLILLALALGCGLVASIGISQVMDRSEPAVGYETAPIYVALHNINLNDPIDGSMVTLQELPKDKIQPGAISQLEDLVGRRPRTLIVAGDAILEAKLLAQGEVHDPIGEIPPGMRLKTIAVDAETSAAGLLSPGDRVDIQFFQVPKN